MARKGLLGQTTKGHRTLIRIRDLRVDYDDVCAVHDLSLDVEPGEVCGLIGPNGAGKTTTMRAMIGLIEPTYGEIEIMGVDVRERPEAVYRVVGFMPDFPPVYEDLLVWEFVDLFAASYGVDRHRRPAAVGRYIELVGLTAKRQAMVGGLSRGMRQRLMLAKTLVAEPKVLLLDEPASGVDPQGRIDLKNILRRLGEEGKTILISSHILTEMNEFCTSVAIMERGSLVISGRIEDVNQRVMGDLLWRSRCWARPTHSWGSSPPTIGPARSSARRTPTNFASEATPRRPATCWRTWCDKESVFAPSCGGGTTWKNCSSKWAQRSYPDGLGPNSSLPRQPDPGKARAPPA